MAVKRQKLFLKPFTMSNEKNYLKNCNNDEREKLLKEL